MAMKPKPLAQASIDGFIIRLYDTEWGGRACFVVEERPRNAKADESVDCDFDVYSEAVEHFAGLVRKHMLNVSWKHPAPGKRLGGAS